MRSTRGYSCVVSSYLPHCSKVIQRPMASQATFACPSGLCIEATVALTLRSAGNGESTNGSSDTPVRPRKRQRRPETFQKGCALVWADSIYSCEKVPAKGRWRNITASHLHLCGKCVCVGWCALTRDHACSIEVGKSDSVPTCGIQSIGRLETKLGRLFLLESLWCWSISATAILIIHECASNLLCIYSETSESGPSLARTPPLERTVPLPPIELPIILIHWNLRGEDASELRRADTCTSPTY